jgi:putative restriction endonuclease
MAPIDPDHDLRIAANQRVRELARRFDDLVPIDALRAGFEFEGQRISFGSFQRGIHKPRQMRGPAALTLMTAAPVPGKPRPYDDELDTENRAIVYHYRAGSIDQPDNRALRAAFEMQAPLIYFHGVAPGQYMVVQPVFITRDDASARTVLLEVGLPVADMHETGLVSSPDIRDYALREVKVRLHQHRFRRDVLRAYRHRCTICALREPQLVQAAHIVEDVSEGGIAAVVNGLALCAIHHLAYDRNLMGIDPNGVVHIADRLRRERDGPMLREGLQGFHGSPIVLPRRAADRPDRTRLEQRFELFVAGADAA